MPCSPQQYNDPSHPCFFENNGQKGDWVSANTLKANKMDELPTIKAGTGLSDQKTPSQPTNIQAKTLNAGVGLTGLPIKGVEIKQVQVYTDQSSANHTKLYANDKNYAGASDKLNAELEKNGAVTEQMAQQSAALSQYFSKLQSEDSLTEEQKDSVGKKILEKLGLAPDVPEAQKTWWQKNGKTVVIVVGVVFSVFVVWYFMEKDKPADLPDSEVLLDLRKKK